MKDITTNLFRVKSPSQTPTAGGLLVAEPFMREGYFNHGVVSLIDYVPDEGATGVVMNNRTEYLLGELLEGIETQARIPVFCGGPLGQDGLQQLDRGAARTRTATRKLGPRPHAAMPRRPAAHRRRQLLAPGRALSRTGVPPLDTAAAQCKRKLMLSQKNHTSPLAEYFFNEGR